MPIISLAAQADSECREHRIRYTLNKAQHFEKQIYCVDFKSGRLTDPACQDLKCLDKVPYNIDRLAAGKDPSIGTLGFHVCHKLFGSPQIIKVALPNGKWRTFDRCRLKGIGTVDTGSLVQFLQSK